MDTEELALVLRALGYERRLKAFLFIAEKPACVTEITEELSMSQPATSSLLADLKFNGLVKFKREGKNNYYHTTKKGRRVLDAMTGLLKGSES